MLGVSVGVLAGMYAVLTQNNALLTAQIDRIVSEYKHARQPTQYLVKWCALEYSESTWEVEEEICRDGAGQVSRWCCLGASTHIRATEHCLHSNFSCGDCCQQSSC